MKKKTKSILVCAVVASVLGAGTVSPASPWAAVCPFGAVAEAWKCSYKVDGVEKDEWDSSDPLIGTGDTLEVRNITGANAIIYGGKDDSVSKKIVTVLYVTYPSDIVEKIFGGYSSTGDATENIVNIKQSITLNLNLVYGGYSESGNATGNIVNMTGGIFKDDFYGGYSKSGKATGNIVNITGGDVNYSVTGGESVNVEASGNTVNISGGNVNYVTGGHSMDGKATGNIVNITGGTVGSVYGGDSVNVEASGNIVKITGGTITDSVYAGDSSNIINGNKVIVSGGNLSNAKVYAYFKTFSSPSHSDNTLQIENSVSIKEVDRFDNINFVLPTDIADNATMLTLTNAVNINDVAVNVYLNGQEPDTVTLIDNATGAGNYNVYTGIADSTTVSDDYTISLESGKLLLKIKEVLWYTVGDTEYKYRNNAEVQSITAAADVTISRGAKAGDNTALNEYSSIDAGEHNVKIDLTTSTKEMTVTGTLTANVVTVSNDNTLNVGAGNLKADVTNNGIVNLGAGTLASGSTVTGGTLNITDNVTANADDIAGDTNTVAEGKTLTFSGGAMTHKVTGEGTLKFTSDMEINADNAATATSVVDNGVTLTVNGGTFDKKLDGAGTLKITGTLHYGTNAELVQTGTQHVGDRDIPVSDVNVTIATGGVMDMKDRASTPGGCINALTFAGGKLDFSGGHVGNLLIAKTLDATAGGSISFDVSATGNDQIGVLNNIASGSKLTLDTINVQNELAGEVAPVGGVSGSITFALDLTGASALNNLIIAGTTTVSGNYMYTFTQDASNKGKLNYKKEMGMGLMQVIQAKDINGTFNNDYAQIANYSFNGERGMNFEPYSQSKIDTLTGDAKTNAENLNKRYGDLGEMKRATGATARTLTINGNGSTLSGGVYAGVIVNNEDTFVLKNVRTVTDGANNKIATNNGTVLLSGSGTMAVKASVDGTGKLIVDGVDAVLGENYRYITGRTALTADELASLKLKVEDGTATEIEQREYEYGWKLNSDGSYVTTLSEVTSAVITQNDLEIRSGSLTANADNLHIANSIVNNSELKFIGGTLSKMVTGTGNLTFDGDVTTNADYIGVSGTNTVNEGKTLTLTDGTLAKVISGAGNLYFNGDVTTNADNIATEGTNTVADGKTLTFNGGALTKKIEGAGGLTFAADMTLNANNIGTTGTNTVSDGKTMTFNGGILTKKVQGAGGLTFAVDMTLNADNIATEGTNTVADGKTLTFDGGTLTKKVQGAGGLTFATDMTLNADNIATEGTNTVESGKTLTFNDGMLIKKVQGAGNLAFATDMTLNANNIGTTGTNTVNSGKTMTFNGGALAQKIEGAGNLKFTGNVTANADNIATTGTNEVATGATLNFADGTLTKKITGDGTTEFNGTVCVADGVQLGAATNNVNGTLDVQGHITASNINFKNGSTLKVDGTKITETAAITGITSATVASGAKLYVSNAEKDTAYKILASSGGIDVSSWTTDDNMGEGFRASYGLVVDTDNTTTAGTGLSEFHIQFKEDPVATGSSDIGNIIANLPAGSEAKVWIDNISANQPDVQTRGNTVNTMANIGGLANVQGGMNAMSSFTSNSIASNIGSESRPMLGNRGQVSGVRNVSANVKDSNAKVEVIEQGKASEVMPTQYEEQKYGKEVWASFIHSKTKIEGMKTGHLEQDSTLQYNGTVVGVDLWSGKHGFGGVALTYGDGNFHSGQMVSNVKNDADYYGISVYNRQDVGKFSFQYDAGFTYAKNDVTMSTMGAEDITAKPKVRAYSAGIKVEEPIKVGRATEVVPFAGARYTFVKSKEYQNSLGLGYDVDNQHLVKIPVGMSLRTKYLDKSGWKFGTTLSGGYSWNLCNRSSQQRVSFGGYSDMIDFDIADRGEYFVNAAVQAEYENLLFELGYNYSKGKTTRSNKWYFNANLGF